MPETEPSQNVYPTDEGTSMALSTTSDDTVIWAEYISIASGETTGTYTGVATSGKEFQHSYKFNYS